jgi:hypothetical protein
MKIKIQMILSDAQKAEIYSEIRAAYENAPRGEVTEELHLQMLKYADRLHDVTGDEFCKGVGIRGSYGAEFSKMRNLTARLKRAGLRFDEI